MHMCIIYKHGMDKLTIMAICVYRHVANCCVCVCMYLYITYRAMYECMCCVCIYICVHICMRMDLQPETSAGKCFCSELWTF